MEANNYIPEITIEVKVNRVGKQKFKVMTSGMAYEILKMIYDEGTIEWREEMILLCLNRSNTVIGYYKVSTGGVSGTVVDPKVIFTLALNTPGTTGIILSHNHPSGNTKPSDNDIKITNRIKQCGVLLEIALLDHLIITSEGYISFSDEGIL